MSKAYTQQDAPSMRQSCRKPGIFGKGLSKGKPFQPEPGQVYQTRDGHRYRCEGLTEAPGCAVMENAGSGWRFIAHGIVQYPDGSIGWVCSTSGRYMW